MSTSIITQVIEWLLDKFKTKNGLGYVIVMAILVGLYGAASYLEANSFGGIQLSANLANIIHGAIIVLGGLVGSSTQAVQKAQDQNKPTITKNT